MIKALRVTLGKHFYQISASQKPEDWETVVGAAEDVQQIEEFAPWDGYTAAYRVTIDGVERIYFAADPPLLEPVAKQADVAHPPRTAGYFVPRSGTEVLTCCCCGMPTEGRQWPTRDTGYGLCPACGDWIIQQEGHQAVHEMAGERGIHWDID